MEMNSRSDWADFPPEVLLLIARELADIRDYIRFRAVCVSWRLAAGLTDLGPQLPWLVVPTHKEGRKINQGGITTISFFNLPGCGRCFYPLVIPETQGKWIYASAHGWLLMIGSRSPESTSSVSLINPITRAIIPLPLLPTSSHKDSNIQKALLCSHPASSPPGRLLAAVWINYDTFAFFRQGDMDWTIIKSASDDIVYLDIVYFQDELYFVDRHGILSLLQLESSTITPLIHPRQPEVKPFLSLYLVEAARDLLLVARYIFVFKLAVFKLHKSANGELNWVVIGDMTPDPAKVDRFWGRGELSFFSSWMGSVCARTLQDGKSYQIYFAEASELNSIMTMSIREIHAVVGVGVHTIEQSLCQARERVGRQRQCLSLDVTWMLPNLH